MNEKVSLNSCVTYYIVRRERHLNSFLTNCEFYTLPFLDLSVMTLSVLILYMCILCISNAYGAVDGMIIDQEN